MCRALRSALIEHKTLYVSRGGLADLRMRAEAEPRGRLARALQSGRVQASSRKASYSAAQRARRKRRAGAGPITVTGYHGSNQRFRRFDRARGGSAAGHRAGQGTVWMTSDPWLARRYGKLAAQRGGGRAAVMRTRARLQRPLVYDAGGKPIYDVVKGRAFSVAVNDARRRGHDGVVFRNVRDGPGRIQEIKPSNVAAIFNDSARTVSRSRRGRR